VAELDVVVDLAVVNQHQATVFGVHRHMPERADVENAQPLHRQGAAFRLEQTMVIRTTVPLNCRHAAHRAQLVEHDAGGAEAKNASNATHTQACSTSERAISRGVPVSTSTSIVRSATGTLTRASYTSTSARSRCPYARES